MTLTDIDPRRLWENPKEASSLHIYSVDQLVLSLIESLIDHDHIEVWSTASSQ